MLVSLDAPVSEAEDEEIGDSRSRLIILRMSFSSSTTIILGSKSLSRLLIITIPENY
jgi:hypothetical protein